MKAIKIGVIGAGTMGAGIAQAFAAKHQVVLCDLEQSAAQAGKARIKSALERQVEKGRTTPEVCAALLANITTGTSGVVGDCDLIVEAAVERIDLKKQLFAELQQVCRGDTVFATNTSSLSVTELSAGLDRPVVGMHFFNPAPVMKLVEVVAGLQTPPELVEWVQALAEDIGKVPVVVQDSAGFVVNRLLIPMINEAVGVLAEGTASAEGIDSAMKLGANHPMGPLALGDLIGLDVCLAIMEVLHRELGDDKYRPHPLLRRMVRGGRLGRKTGRGFFVYTP